MIKHKNVKFIPRDENTSNILDFPKPAKNYLPSWYKDLSANWKKNNFLFAGPTRCMPFFDSFASGYMMLKLNMMELIKILEKTLFFIGGQKNLDR